MRIVFFTGAGISAESGLRTFRDSDGLWEQYQVTDVATPDAWARDPALVLRFYGQRHAQTLAARPNPAHAAIAALEQDLDVTVVTQNIDDLHERAGSSRVLHLHGEIRKARSTRDPRLVQPITGPYPALGDRCPLGSQLRPHIVWFGEDVPLLSEAADIVSRADLLVVVGSSLQVYPAAGLVHATRAGTPVHLVDPGPVELTMSGVTHWKEKASQGIPKLADLLRKRYA
ncbi:MAG: NAD-dependent deacylase [Flavobacteriales bacterium]